LKKQLKEKSEMKKIEGFVQNGPKEIKGIYDSHEGKLVNISKGPNIIYGVFEKIYKDKLLGEFVASLRPSIIFNPNNTYSIEYDRPSQVSLPFDVIRPMQGSLEKWVDKFNSDTGNSEELMNL